MKNSAWCASWPWRQDDILLDYYAGESSVEWKGRNDPVAAADGAASRFLGGRLREMFPGDGILSEEAADDSGRLGRHRVWIDPMDGTNALKHGAADWNGISMPNSRSMKKWPGPRSTTAPALPTHGRN
jgi:fructose-1,6-bisphosphatase/inositol monophosphatase family enzyme